MSDQNSLEIQLRESGIAKLIASTGITEAELRALGLMSNGNN